MKTATPASVAVVRRAEDRFIEVHAALDGRSAPGIVGLPESRRRRSRRIRERKLFRVDHVPVADVGTEHRLERRADRTERRLKPTDSMRSSRFAAEVEVVAKQLGPSRDDTLHPAGARTSSKHRRPLRFELRECGRSRTRARVMRVVAVGHRPTATSRSTSSLPGSRLSTKIGDVALLRSVRRYR